MHSEKSKNSVKFDLDHLYETERKFAPHFPGELSPFIHHESAVAIEQIYLSTPDEPFSLRLRALVGAAGVRYEATLKDRGTIERGSLHRFEVTTPVDDVLYNYYASEHTPRVNKIRVEPVSAVTIDFYDDATIQIESEDELRWQEFTATYGIAAREITGLPESDNEQRAYRNVDYGPLADVSIDGLVDEVLERKRQTDTPLFVHIGGRSGSGKSTVVRGLVEQLAAQGVTSEVMSTDDYHRGQTWLTRHNNGQPWQRWDDPIVYDIDALAIDLQTLSEGGSVRRRTIDWQTVEPHYDEVLLPAEVVIVEGIYALSNGLIKSNAVVRELQTPLATCIGRRLLRDLKERPQFADPAASLSYMLREVEPTYRRQQAQRQLGGIATCLL